MRSQQGKSPNDKLNIACCGVGGRGADAAMKVTNDSDANRFVTSQYRPGFGV